MATRTSKPLQPSKDQRRVALARYFSEAVEPLLAAGESFSDISVERLITSVDISRSTFYTYFDDKGDLLKAIGEDVTVDLAAAGAHWFELSVTADRADLRESLVPLFHTYRRHQWVLQAITEAALHLALVERAATGLAEHLRVQLAAGAVPTGLDADLTSRWLVWMLERGLYQMVAPAGPDKAEQLLNALTGLVWRMLYEGHHTSSS
jgi:AcrR family transcriptional regulator